MTTRWKRRTTAPHPAWRKAERVPHHWRLSAYRDIDRSVYAFWRTPLETGRLPMTMAELEQAMRDAWRMMAEAP